MSLGEAVYDSVQSAVAALRLDAFATQEVAVTEDVYDSFDPMDHLDSAVVRVHSECCGFNDSREYAHLEVIDRGTLSRWDETTHSYVPFRWTLGWRRPGKELLMKILQAAFGRKEA